MGFAHVQQVYHDGTRIPSRDGTTRRVRIGDRRGGRAAPCGTADIPERGEYAVYVSYDSTSAKR